MDIQDERVQALTDSLPTVITALAEANPKHFETLILYAYGYSPSKIAQMLDYDIQTVYNTIQTHKDTYLTICKHRDQVVSRQCESMLMGTLQIMARWIGNTYRPDTPITDKQAVVACQIQRSVKELGQFLASNKPKAGHQLDAKCRDISSDLSAITTTGSGSAPTPAKS